GLALEPATPDGGLVVERAGSGQFLIETTGRAAHVGRDFTSGISAVTALAQMIVRAQTLSDPARSIIVNIGPIQGGTATNVVPDHAKAWGNVRFPTPQDAAELSNRLNDLAMEVSGRSGSLPNVKVQTSFIRAAKPLTLQTQKLADAARRAAEDLGQRLPFSK